MHLWRIFGGISQVCCKLLYEKLTNNQVLSFYNENFCSHLGLPKMLNFLNHIVFTKNERNLALFLWEPR